MVQRRELLSAATRAAGLRRSGNGQPHLSEQARCALSAAKRQYRERRHREELFGDNLFGDPVWDILLDLFVATLEERQVPVTSACAAAIVPTTTAMRYLKHMQAANLIERVPHPKDSRCTILELTPMALEKMLTHFSLAHFSLERGL